jgi:hypothetical protein
VAVVGKRLTTSMEEHKDGLGAGCAFCPDIQSQTVLTLRVTKLSSEVGNDCLELRRAAWIIDWLRWVLWTNSITC